MTPRQAKAALEQLAEERDDLLFGGCVGFALALHKLSGWPLYGLLGYDAEIDQDVLVHAYVRPNVDMIVDIRGPRTFDEMYDDFADDPAWEGAEELRLTTQQLVKVGLRKSRCPTLRAELPVAARVLELTRRLL
jgi:hypothetical protein